MNKIEMKIWGHEEEEEQRLQMRMEATAGFETASRRRRPFLTKPGAPGRVGDRGRTGVCSGQTPKGFPTPTRTAQHGCQLLFTLQLRSGAVPDLGCSGPPAAEQMASCWPAAWFADPQGLRERAGPHPAGFQTRSEVSTLSKLSIRHADLTTAL